MENRIKEKYLFFYLKTGGGHLAPARSIAEYLSQTESNLDIKLIDGFTGSPNFVRTIIEDGYRILQSKSKWIYEIFYAVNKINYFTHQTAMTVSLFIKRGIKEIISEETPDKIVIFHFFLIKPIFAVVKELKLNIPIITVVTDPYIAHPLWFLRKKQNFIVSSKRLKDNCLRKGIPSENINVFPFVLSQKFSSIPGKNTSAAAKKELRFDNKNLLLILGGGDGIPNGMKILQALIHEKPNYNIVMVCGKNEKLFRRAKKYESESVKIFGFVDFVDLLLNAADAVVTKCGASTFMEILLMGKIPIVNSYIWEQEKGNVDFLIEKKLGIYEKNFDKMAKIVERLFSDSNFYFQFKNNIENYGFQNGLLPVSDFIKNFRIE